MPSNKEALIRYRAINNALRSGRVVDREKLIEVCTEAIGAEVSWRSIAGDIRAMRQDELLGYHAPIENVRNVGYRYTDPNYSIDKIPLKDDEVTALSFAARLLRQYSGVELFSTASGAVDKLYQNLDVRLLNNDVADLGNLISFEDSTADGGSKYINDLLQHIRQKTVVNIDYQSFSSGRRRNHIIHPYYIKEYRNRWYVLGYHETHNEVRTFALERIQSIEPVYDVVYKESEIDLKTYYKNAVGVSIMPGGPEKITINVARNQWPYLSSQPIHASQQVLDETEQVVTIELNVINNFELRSTLLSLGGGIEIISPEHLRQQICDEAQNILMQYGKTRNP